MQLNIITDQWIPVRRKDGSRVTIAPWEMADPDLAFPDWPRPDLNIACLELLIGLVFMADPPRDTEDWRARQGPDPHRLKAALEPFAPAFNLLGDGPRFMQDMEKLEENATNVSRPDMLFIDSAGGQTAKNNADLMVKRDRYAGLPAPKAAMALYTLQAHAPTGGAGNRTSMRGGGPMVTLVEPYEGGLWSIVWANVPVGNAASMKDLPWCRPACLSEKGQFVFPQDVHPVEAFFGMPRRLRFISDDGAVTGIVQKRYGANYAGWMHPLTPHYRQKAGSELLPRHPKPGGFTYRNWLGVVERTRRDASDMARRAEIVEVWTPRSGTIADVIVAGWAMDNMKPRDFVFSRAPLIDLDDDALERMEGLVTTAEKMALALRGALEPVLAAGEAREAAREDVYLRTQPAFEGHLAALQKSPEGFEPIARAWLDDLKKATLDIFDTRALPGLGDRDISDQQKIVAARGSLEAAFRGYTKMGREAFIALGLEAPKKGRRKTIEETST